MNSLGEIFGTSESDEFSSLSTDVIGKSTEDLVLSHEEINFGTIFDFDLRWPEVKNVRQGTCQDILPIEKALLKPDDPLFSYSFQQSSLLDQGFSIQSGLGIVDDQYYDPNSFFMSWQNLPEIASPYCPPSLLREPHGSCPITLVLDLDGMMLSSCYLKFNSLRCLVFCESIDYAAC